MDIDLHLKFIHSASVVLKKGEGHTHSFQFTVQIHENHVLTLYTHIIIYMYDEKKKGAATQYKCT